MPGRPTRAGGTGSAGGGILLAAIQVQTATVGARTVRGAVGPEIGAGLKAFISECRAALPGLIRCSYFVRRSRPAGPKEGGAFYEDFYLWDGFRCHRLRHRVTDVS